MTPHFKVYPSKPTVLGLLFEGDDPSAALLKDGRIAALAEEERFTRVKHARNSFPTHSASYCLRQSGIGVEDLDCIAVGWDAPRFPVDMAHFYLDLWSGYRPSRDAVNWQLRNLTRYSASALTERLTQALLRDVQPDRRPPVRFIRHHFAHACSAFYPSGFPDAAIVTADGHGEHDCTNIWVAEAGRIRHLAEWTLPHSLGWFYTKFTEWFGFEPHDGEGKLMGLAAYGQANGDLAAKVGDVISFTGDLQVYRLTPEFFFDEWAPEGHFSRRWIDLFGPPRPLGSKKAFDQYHVDLAFAVQSALERAGIGLVDVARGLSGKDRVCVAGGTFMNCKMNGVLAARIGFDRFFAQPLAGDNGVALGAALAAYHQLGVGWSEPLTHVAFGPEYGEEDIRKELLASGLPFRKSADIARDTAGYLAESKIVGWFQGRMEAGARALGKRSILANPCDPLASDIVNQKVKFRESWRPFCPSALSGEASQHFACEGPLPYMIVACEARPGVKARLPSVVHVDNTVRVQTVTRDHDPRFHRLLEAFRQLSGYGVVLNTSFNVKGEPIVCSPRDAINCFLSTGIDILVLGDFICEKVPSLLQTERQASGAG